ncbi:hypothetical protein D3C85_1208270 [compost metagenome]
MVAAHLDSLGVDLHPALRAVFKQVPGDKTVRILAVILIHGRVFIINAVSVVGRTDMMDMRIGDHYLSGRSLIRSPGCRNIDAAGDNLLVPVQTEVADLHITARYPHQLPAELLA